MTSERCTSWASQAFLPLSSIVRHSAPSLTSVEPLAGDENDVNHGRLLPSLNDAFRSKLCAPSAGAAMTTAGALASAREAFLQPASPTAPEAPAASSSTAAGPRAPNLDFRSFIIVTPAPPA